MSSVFDTINFTTETGVKVKAIISERLEELRAALESPNMGELETAKTRGAIAELKQLLRVAPPMQAPLRYSGHRRSEQEGGM